MIKIYSIPVIYKEDDLTFIGNDYINYDEQGNPTNYSAELVQYIEKKLSEQLITELEMLDLKKYGPDDYPGSEEEFFVRWRAIQFFYENIFPEEDFDEMAHVFNFKSRYGFKGYFIHQKIKNTIEKLKAEEPATLDIFEEQMIYTNSIVHKYMREYRDLFKDTIKESRKNFKKEFQDLFEDEILDVAQIKCIQDIIYNARKRIPEEENMIFIDLDFDTYFFDGFINGIKRIAGRAGEEHGYGIDYTKEIFYSIGLEPPHFLSEEEMEVYNIEHEISRAAYMKWLGEMITAPNNP